MTGTTETGAASVPAPELVQRADAAACEAIRGIAKLARLCPDLAPGLFCAGEAIAGVAQHVADQAEVGAHH